MEPHTLILTPWMKEHRIVPWREAVCKLIGGTIRPLHTTWDGEPFIVATPSRQFEIPSVAQLTTKIPYNKKGVKFSRINILTRDNHTCQYCLAPDHKILTSDLQWVSLGDLEEGDRVVGFDEESDSYKGRRFKESVVESHVFSEDELYLVTLDDGTQFRVTKEHQWLARKRNLLTWVRTDELTGLSVPRLFNVWSTENTREAGWTAGVFDGEGWLTTKGFQAAVAQNPGQVLERLKQFMRDRDFDFGSALVNDDSVCVRLSLRGGYASQAQFLGSVRPERLIGDFRPEKLGMIRSNEYHRVVAVESIGRGEIVKMRTSSSTFIADGFPHHNCGKRFPRRQLNYDHVIPRKQGGKTVWENIVSSCYPCNSRKAGRTPEQAGMRLIQPPYRPRELPLTAPAFPIDKAPEEWKFYLDERFQAAFG